jgi:hypothetical protein
MDPSSYFISDVTVIFLEGTHLLNDTVVIDGVSNLVLRGEGEVVPGDYWTVNHSNVIITCDNSNASFFFINWTNVYIYMITFNSCGSPLNNRLHSEVLLRYSDSDYNWNYTVGVLTLHTLLFVNGTDLLIDRVTVQHGRGIGLTIVNSYGVLINNSWFYKNNFHNCSYPNEGGNIRIAYVPSAGCPQVGPSPTSSAIRNTYVSFGCNYGFQGVSGSGILAMYTLMPVGGGIGLAPADYTCNNYSVILHNIVAYGNTAFSNGPNVAMVILPIPMTITNLNSSHGTSRCYVPNNSCNGLGLFFQVFKTLPSNVVGSSLTVTDSTMSHNEGLYSGSGLFVKTLVSHSWDHIFIQRCDFSHNVGRYGIGVFIERVDHVNTNYLNVTLSDVTIVGSKKYILDVTDTPGLGALTLINVICSVSGLTVNDSTSVRGISLTVSQLYVFGHHNVIFDNHMVNGSGGGIFLNGHSFIIFNSPSSLYLIDNSADHLGGGIAIEQSVNVYMKPNCFFQVNDPSGSTTSNVALHAINNMASTSGNFLSGGDITLCIPVTNSNFAYCHNHNETCGVDQLMEILYPKPYPTHDLYFISSEPISVSLCTNDSGTVDLSYNERLETVQAYPGRVFYIDLVAVSYPPGISAGDANVKVISNRAVTKEYTVYLPNYCAAIPFVIYYHGSDEAEIQLRTPLIIENIVRFSYIPLKITVEFQECPPGFGLSKIERKCDCNSYINASAYCNINTTSIQVSDVQNTWIGYNFQLNCTYHTANCPFDFCTQDTNVSIYFNDTIYDLYDPRCALNRTGILCGGCPEGLSLMLGSNRCGDCTNNGYIALSLVFAVFGILLVVLLISLDLTVTVGTINGLLFYANIIKAMQLNYVVYFQWFISWLNLDFGIETCFFNGMTAITKTWLQFVFPIYLLLLVFLLAVFVRFITSYSKFQFITRWFLHINFINVFATILLLSYSKFIQIMFNVFSVSPVHCDNLVIYEWSFNGNLEYATGQHLYLLIFECIFVVIFVVPYTMFVIGLPVVEKLPVIPKCGGLWLKIKPFCDAYGSPYNDRYRFWTGLLIVCRIILVVPSSLLSVRDYSVLIIFIVIVLLALIVVIRGPYKSQFLIILEVWFLLNVLGVTSLSLASDQYGRIGAVVSVALTFITFIGIVIYHLAVRLKVAPKIKAKILKNKSYRNLSFISGSEQISLNVPNTAIGIEDLDHADYRHYRDSILELNDDK